MTERDEMLALAEHRSQAYARLHVLCGTRADAPRWDDIATLLREIELLRSWQRARLETDDAATAIRLTAAPAPGVREALMHAADIALSIDSGRGNERAIAIAIRQYATQLELAKTDRAALASEGK